MKVEAVITSNKQHIKNKLQRKASEREITLTRNPSMHIPNI